MDDDDDDIIVEYCAVNPTPRLPLKQGIVKVWFFVCVCVHSHVMHITYIPIYLAMVHWSLISRIY